MSIYEPKSHGKYVFAQRYIVLGNRWQLFPDILDSQRDPPMSRRKELTVGHVEFDVKNSSNQLVNDEGSTWRVRLNGKPILTAEAALFLYNPAQWCTLEKGGGC